MAAMNNVLYSITWVHQICVYNDPCKTSTVRMNEEAERILSKPVIYSSYVVKNAQIFGKDGKNLINLRFVLMCL